MKELGLVLPTQLFEKHPLYDVVKKLVVVEHPRYFSAYSFHPQKLVYHRASMRAWYDAAVSDGHDVTYVEHTHASTAAIIEWCVKHQVSVLHMVDPVDHPFLHEFSKAASAHHLKLVLHDTPLFLSTMPELLTTHGREDFFMASFYQRQRKSLGVLLDRAGKPVGGKWSYDAENRQKMPAGTSIPALPVLSARDKKYIHEAEQYVSTHFSWQYGSLQGTWFPVSTAGARAWFAQFLQERLEHFGVYQDAMVQQETLLFHAGITPMLNTGILLPSYVLEQTLSYANTHKKIPINSLEGFIRQLIGWREFVRYVYELIGDKQRGSNFWHHHKELPLSCWKGTTGVVPFDEALGRVLQTAYAHHIERLMVFGNFFQLCGIKPDAVFEWFMSLFIDAYDWVMVPNVYGMALYADGGMITTKPYISGSAYLKKMGNFKQGTWCADWDALYWHFIVKHASFISQNPRLSVMTMYLRRMDQKKLHDHVDHAVRFIKSL